MPTVVLGVSGCIGAYKACEVLRELQRHGLEVRVVMTHNATRFVGPATFEALSRHPVLVDPFELEAGEMPHIVLADAADLLLVAPATANVLGKFARGIADDALSTLYTATRAPLVVAPAMNVNMYEHPAVLENLAILRARGVRVVEPGAGYLACGWLGKGRLAEVQEIVAAALAVLARRSDWTGRRVLVSAGPTIEDLDPVRFVSNRSSGRMGYHLAEAARDRGAQVVLVAGPTALPDPSGLRVEHVRSALDMQAALERELEAAELVLMAAAVSDYRPARVEAHKVKKRAGGLTLEFVRTPDILAGLAERKGRRFVVGFAAETQDVLAAAREKLQRKQLDLIVANDVSVPGVGFGSERNAAVLLDARGGRVDVPECGKRELAERILDRVAELGAGGPAEASTERQA